MRVVKPGEDEFSLKGNFFSLLFLYTFHRAGIPQTRRVLYAATLQCLRGMVTGCDNLLDDEYKKTLDTDIPETGYRFRSVIDIMVSDRVLFELLMEAHQDGLISLDQVVAASAASMRSMTRSGVQEASEEKGISAILRPKEILDQVHHLKTGLLFNCPWDIPLELEPISRKDIAPLLEGLYQVGLGCQIMDDLADLGSDLEQKRHNYLVSLIYHGKNRVEKSRLKDLMEAPGRGSSGVDLAHDFPDSLARAAETSTRFLETGLAAVFSEEHQALTAPAIRFLRERIGVVGLIPGSRP